MDEVVASAIGAIRCWQSEKPRFTAGYFGSLVLTNRRLMFLSTGGYNSLSLRGATGVPAGTTVSGTVKDLILSILQNKGSLQIPLDRLDTYEVKRMWTLAAYLTIRFRDSESLTRVCSFLCEGVEGLSKSILENMRASVDEARKSH